MNISNLNKNHIQSKNKENKENYYNKILSYSIEKNKENFNIPLKKKITNDPNYKINFKK